jgi:hypothetical protein
MRRRIRAVLTKLYIFYNLLWQLLRTEELDVVHIIFEKQLI